MGRAAAKHCFTINKDASLWRKKPTDLGRELDVPYPPLYPIIKQELPASAGLMAACALKNYNLHDLFVPMLREDFNRMIEERDYAAPEHAPLSEDAIIRWADVTRDMWAMSYDDEPGAIGAKRIDDVVGIAGGIQGTNLFEEGYAVTWSYGWPKGDKLFSGIYVYETTNPPAWEALNRRFGLAWDEHTFDGTRMEGRPVPIVDPGYLDEFQEVLGIPENQRVPWTD